MLVPVASVLPLARDFKDRATAAYKKHKDKLFQSILQTGLKNPIKVVRDGDKHRIVSGQTRFDCLVEQGHAEVPVDVLPDGMSNLDLLRLELVENNMTLGFDALAQCQMVCELMKEMGCNAAELCRQVPGLSEGSVSKYVAVHHKLEPEFKRLLAEGTMAFRVAYALTMLDPDRRPPAWDEVRLMKAEAAEARIRAKLGKGGRAKVPKLKLAVPGLVMTLATGTVTAAKEAFDKVYAALQKLERLNLPIENLPGLLKAT